jgi:hypothetical protein
MAVHTEQRDALRGDVLAAGEAELPAANDALLRFRQALLGGQNWFEALLDAVGEWRAPVEYVSGRRFQYVYHGEAFDWLLLAERLLEAVPGLVPADDADALVYEGRWPFDIDDDEFARRIGPVKHRAHLNYLYGVLVEEALQLAVEEEIHKEHRCQPWQNTARVQEIMFERVYGFEHEDLFAKYYEETGIMLRGDVDYGDWKAFTYWLFKLRLKRQDKARVASDTRRGLAQLTRMELQVSERRHGATLGEADFAGRFVIG